MSDLEDAKELLMKITKHTVSTGNPTSLQLAVVILLKDYIERARTAKREVDE
jgi:HD superfamily phosphohydrolase YqeK